MFNVLHRVDNLIDDLVGDAWYDLFCVYERVLESLEGLTALVCRYAGEQLPRHPISKGEVRSRSGAHGSEDGGFSQRIH